MDGYTSCSSQSFIAADHVLTLMRYEKGDKASIQFSTPFIHLVSDEAAAIGAPEGIGEYVCDVRTHGNTEAS